MCPQHLQQQDLYHEQLGADRLNTAVAYPWGVLNQVIDPGSLGAGELRVTEFQGILPDGTPLNFAPDELDAPAARPVAPHFRAGQSEAVEVFLGLPVEREGAASFEQDTQASGQFPPRTRYSALPRLVKDLAGEARPTEILVGRRNVAVLFGDEPRDDFSVIKIAEVGRDGRGHLVLIDTYIPPCLRISASPFIRNSLSRILNVLLGKHKELASQRRERDASTVEFGSTDVTRYLQLTAVGGLVPVFNHLARLGDVAPRELYLTLAQAAGQLMSFAPDADPTRLPIFVYTDLRSTFEELFGILNSLLQTTVREASVNVPLMLKNGVLFGRLDSAEVARCRHFVIGVRVDGVKEEEIVNKLGTLSKIASWNQIQHVVRAATPGVPIKVTHRPAPEIAIKSGTVYFNVEIDNSYWKQVLEEKAVAIYFPPPFDPSRAKIECLGIPPRAD